MAWRPYQMNSDPFGPGQFIMSWPTLAPNGSSYAQYALVRDASECVMVSERCVIHGQARDFFKAVSGAASTGLDVLYHPGSRGAERFERGDLNVHAAMTNGTSSHALFFPYFDGVLPVPVTDHDDYKAIERNICKVLQRQDRSPQRTCL